MSPHLTLDARILKFKHYVPVDSDCGEKYLWLYHNNEILNDEWDFGVYHPTFAFKYEEDKVKFILKWG